MFSLVSLASGRSVLFRPPLLDVEVVKFANHLTASLLFAYVKRFDHLAQREPNLFRPLGSA